MFCFILFLSGVSQFSAIVWLGLLIGCSSFRFEIVKFLRFRSVFLSLFSGKIGNGKNHFIFLSYVCSYMKEGKRKWNLVSFISFLQTEFHSCFVALLFSWFVPFGGWCILIVYFVLLFGHLLLTYILHYLSKKGKRIPFHFLFKVVLSL